MSWQNETKVNLIVLILHDCITFDINVTLLWWIGVVKSSYQFSSSWCFLSRVTPWFVWNVDSTNIWISTSLKLIFKVSDHKFRTAFSHSAFQWLLLTIYWGKNNISFFEQFWTPQKNLSSRLFIPFLKYQLMEFILNNLWQTLFNLIVRRVTKEGELVFWNKYLDWGY